MTFHPVCVDLLAQFLIIIGITHQTAEKSRAGTFFCDMHDQALLLFSSSHQYYSRVARGDFKASLRI